VKNVLTKVRTRRKTRVVIVLKNLLELARVNQYTIKQNNDRELIYFRWALIIAKKASSLIENYVYRRSNKMTRREKYFIKQKLIGILMAILSVLSVIWLGGEAAVALIFVPIGLMLIFSKDMVWMDKYYFEVKQREEERRIRRSH
jgi:hypothetical protein